MNAVISARILAALATGLELPAAYDSVMGKGTYLKMAGEVYDAARAA